MASEKFDNNQRRRGESLSREEWTHLVKQAGLDAASKSTLFIMGKYFINNTLL
jgi:hypothetical protein